MPLLEKTNIDQVIMNGDSTNAEDDDYGLKDDQRNNGVTKTQDVGCFYSLFVLITYKAGFVRICLHCTCNVIQHFNLLHIITTVSANAGVVSDSYSCDEQIA